LSLSNAPQPPFFRVIDVGRSKAQPPGSTVFCVTLR
jgi:hypothetical protein